MYNCYFIWLHKTLHWHSLKVNSQFLPLETSAYSLSKIKEVKKLTQRLPHGKYVKLFVMQIPIVTIILKSEILLERRQKHKHQPFRHIGYFHFEITFRTRNFKEPIWLQVVRMENVFIYLFSFSLLQILFFCKWFNCFNPGISHPSNT